MEKMYTQPEAAAMLGYKHYRSLNALIKKGYLECMKRDGRNGKKIFSEKHLQNYLNSKMV